jgi:diaminopimelate decarboxylase
MLTEVVFKKTGGEKIFVIVDAGMNDLIRPCLYEAFHFIWPVEVEDKFVLSKRMQDVDLDGAEIVDIVGPVCEGTDYFAKDRTLPPVERGDLVAVFSAGAYGYTMASNYNARPMCPEVLVDGDQYTVIRKRQTYQDLVDLEK